MNAVLVCVDQSRIVDQQITANGNDSKFLADAANTKTNTVHTFRGNGKRQKAINRIKRVLG